MAQLVRGLGFAGSDNAIDGFATTVTGGTGNSATGFYTSVSGGSDNTASGAVSELPEHGGLPPDVGINLDYFVDENGFSRPMAKLPGPGYDIHMPDMEQVT